MSGKYRIIADIGEKGSKVVKILDAEIELRIERLEIGDYLVSERVVIERKTARDFISSIIDKRLFNQIAEMKEHYEKPVLIIEGCRLESARIHPHAVSGALSSIAINYAIPVIFTGNAKKTAELILTMARQEQEGARKVSLIKKKKADSFRKMQLRVIESLPGIGESLALSLLNHFGSVERVFNATPSELMRLEKIGRKKADEIRRVITARVDEEVRDKKISEFGKEE